MEGVTARLETKQLSAERKSPANLPDVFAVLLENGMSIEMSESVSGVVWFRLLDQNDDKIEEVMFTSSSPRYVIAQQTLRAMRRDAMNTDLIVDSILAILTSPKNPSDEKLSGK